MKDIVIRVWQRNDLEAIREITWESWMTHYVSFIPEEDLRHYFGIHYTLESLSAWFDDPLVCGFVAKGRKVLGYARTHFNEADGRYYLSSLYLDPCCKGERIGKKLLDAAEVHARKIYRVDDIWLGVMVQNIGALDWYRKMGFRFIQEEPFTMGKTTVCHLIGYKAIHQRI